MIRNLIFSILSIVVLTATAADNRYTDYVNPFIGTSGTGHTFPGATTPMGLVQLSPQTGNFTWEYCSGYQYNDSKLFGFSHTQISGTGVGDLGDVLILPFQTAEPSSDLSVPFSKRDETASPGYYKTVLTDDNIDVELTATPHVGIHRYSYNKRGDAKILINIDRTIRSWGEAGASSVSDASYFIEDEKTISGSIRSSFWVARSVFFTIKFDQPIKDSQLLKEKDGRILVVDFGELDQLQLQVGISTVSIEGAKENLAAECQGKTFDQHVSDADDQWNSYLSVIDIEGDSDQKSNFYTSLYHLYVQPNNIADVNGEYRGVGDKVFKAESGKYYSTFSLWDTFRAAHPLYTILNPKLAGDLVESIVLHGEAKGYLPVWTLWGKENHCMVGNHAVPVVVDAYLKGLYSDGDRAYSLIKSSLTKNSWEKYDWSIYDKYGYLPSDTIKVEAVSRTLEATIDDWSAAQMAKSLGLDDDYKFFMDRSKNYENLYDSSTGLMRGKNRDGSWVTPFDPFLLAHDSSVGGDYTEGNAWQYSWHVLQDPDALVELMGGKKSFLKQLDTLFSLESDKGYKLADVTGLIGQYAHGNEPSHHVVYLYNYADRHDKVTELIPSIIADHYKNKPDGLIGNDDCGQMSAWYIFSTLGFYPVNPVSGVFDLGVPAYKEASIKLGDKTFTVKAPRLSKKNRSVKSITLNGEKIDSNKITYKQIMDGGVLKFNMKKSK